MKEQIDFGNLADPEETPKQRRAFCSRASSAKPVAQEVARRITRETARIWLGKTWRPEELAYINGFFDCASRFAEMFDLLDGEHQDYLNEKNNPVETNHENPIGSGSQL